MSIAGHQVAASLITMKLALLDGTMSVTCGQIAHTNIALVGSQDARWCRRVTIRTVSPNCRTLSSNSSPSKKSNKVQQSLCYPGKYDEADDAFDKAKELGYWANLNSIQCVQPVTQSLFFDML